jgi:predicted porin
LSTIDIKAQSNVWPAPSARMTRERNIGLFLGKTAFLAALVAPAYAGDLPSIKIPETPPLTWQGITFYGAYDVSAAYLSRGVPINGSQYVTAGLITPQNGSKGMWVMAPNQEGFTFFGIKLDREVAPGLKIVAKAETGFIPYNGELDNAPAALQRQNGVPLALQSTAGPGNRAGQFFNGSLYAGLATDAFGQFTVGRQLLPSVEVIGAYDALTQSFGFGLLGFNGTWNGMGSTDLNRLDDSVRYSYSNGPFHGVAYFAAPGTNVKNLWQLDLGYTWGNLSVDAVGGHANDGTAITSLSGAANLNSSFIGARVFDSDMYSVWLKYKLTENILLSAGWEHIVLSNPADGGFAPGHVTVGGYVFGPKISATSSPTGGVVNNAFTGGDRYLDLFYVGAKYRVDPKLTFALGYYRYNSSGFGYGVTSPIFSKTSCSSSKFSNCSGYENVVAFRVDYEVSRNLNIYAGTSYSQVAGGIAFGYQHTDMWDPTIGAVVRW